jgi:putative MATE family efflux protein
VESEDALREPYEKGRIALDILEPGDDEKDFGEFERVSKKLPPQVTSGMLYRDIVRIAWPSMLEIALTQLTSMADMAMVGRLGSWAITSVGLTTQPKFLLMIMFMAMNVGATALIARSKGEGDLQKANAILRQALLLTFVLAIVSSVLGFIFSESLVRFMGAQDAATIVGGTVYLRIQMVGFLFFALTTTITAALRGVGDSRTAMVYNMTANVVNVILNYCLIYGHFGFPRMEVAGASLATIIGQFVAFVMALYAVMRRSNYLHLSLRDGFKPRWDYMQGIFRIGIPALFEQAIMRAGMILFTKTVASLGTVAFATHQVCLNIQQLTFLNGQAFAVSATSLMGQSLGKKRPDMAQAYTSRTRRIGMTISIMLGIMFLIFRKEIITL